MRSKKNPLVMPVVKWVGGKGQLVSEIRKKHPAELGKTVKNTPSHLSAAVQSSLMF